MVLLPNFYTYVLMWSNSFKKMRNNMQKILVLTLTFTLIASISFAGAFSPELLEISAPFNIDYAFDGSILDIPVTITGTPATVIFLVFTRNKAAEISDIQNGYLGWHYVNNIDTCIYVSQDWKFGTGVNIITWEGSDADGNPVPKDDKDGYTYYLFAFDHVTRKQKAAPIIIPWEDASMILKDCQYLILNFTAAYGRELIHYHSLVVKNG